MLILRRLRRSYKSIFVLITILYVINRISSRVSLYGTSVPIKYISSEVLDSTRRSQEFPYSTADLAYVQYATSINYLCQCLLNFIKLRNTSSAIPNLVILYSSRIKKRIPSHFLNHAKDHFIELREVYPIFRDSSDTTWSDSFTKFHIWNQVDFKRIVYFDSDSMIMAHMDELFQIPKDVRYASPIAYWLDDLVGNQLVSPVDVLTISEKDRQEQYQRGNTIIPFDAKLATHVMVIEPDAKVFDKLVSLANWKRKDQFDMELINKFVSSRSNQAKFDLNPAVIPHQRYGMLTGELRSLDHTRFMTDAPHLHITTSLAYQDSSEEYKISDSYWNLWDTTQIIKSVKLVHFSDHPIPKPWVKQDPLAAYSQYKIGCGAQDETWVIKPMMIDDCEAVKWWNYFYDEFAKNYQETCWIEIK